MGSHGAVLARVCKGHFRPRYSLDKTLRRSGRWVRFVKTSFQSSGVRFQSDEGVDGRPAVTDNRELTTEHLHLISKERSVSGCFHTRVTRRGAPETAAGLEHGWQPARLSPQELTPISPRSESNLDRFPIILPSALRQLITDD
jgi:hypothetical protein